MANTSARETFAVLLLKYGIQTPYQKISQKDESSAPCLTSLSTSARGYTSAPIEYEIFTPFMEVSCFVTASTAGTEMWRFEGSLHTSLGSAEESGLSSNLNTRDFALSLSPVLCT